MLNSQDAMCHATFKSELGKEGPPSKHGGHSELLMKVQKVCKSFGSTAVQKGFVRSYSRNELGHLDEKLIPSAIKDWYLDKESNVSVFKTYVEDDERQIVSLLNLLKAIEVQNKFLQKIAIFVGLTIFEFTLNGRISSRNYRKNFKKIL